MNADVIVVGGGVIGLMSAWRLAQAGMSVVLLEKGKPASEASSAALGVLSPQADAGRPSDFLRLAQASLALFGSLAEELGSESGVDIELRDEGMLYLALSEADNDALRAGAERQKAAGVPVDLISGDDARGLEPTLGPNVVGALFFTGALQVDNVRFGSALLLAANRAGVQVLQGRQVTRIVKDGGRVAGVEAGSTIYRAPAVIIAAGSWSGTIEGLSLPVRPAKGQALSLDAPFVLSHIIDSEAGYVVPRRDGRLLVGATVEDAGYDKRVTVSAIQSLLAGVSRAVPALKDSAIREMWAGLRPCAADSLPVLGPMAGCEGLFAATGHFRNGILLAPITAQLVTAWLTRKPLTVDVSSFSPNRFA
jgi:glycine oxidase